MELFMVEVRVADWVTSCRWYIDILGLRPALEDRERRFLLLEAGSGKVALKEGPVIPDRGAVRLIFRVGDVTAERERLVGLGVAVSGMTESDEGYREVRLADPDGTPIHLFSWAGAGPDVVADGGPAG
jgi:catechol 2,3-dioxygenase-like lactoylglutathione lyase family enzyme